MYFALNEPNKLGKLGIHIAAQRGDIQVLDLIVKVTPDLMITTNLGQTCLHMAVENNNNKAAEELIKIARNRKICSAFLDAQDKSGKTALHWAASNGNLELFNILVSHGASTNITDLWNATPLVLAQENYQ